MNHEDKQHRARRIAIIATEMVETRVQKGELDETNEAQMEEAIAEAIRDAKAVFDAAAEYIS